MRLSKVRAGQQIGTVKIVSVKRRHAYAYITFTDGKITKTVTLHKSQSFQVAIAGPMAAVSLDRRTMERVRRVAATDPRWRGENSGHRGERFVATNGAWDRATKEITPRA
jgi:hypothetical protein